jgi:hypothetical protein
MSADDRHRAREALAWLATDRLDEDERRRVEAALESDAEGRELLALARSMVRAADERDPARYADEPHPQLLVTYVRAPEELDPATRAYVETCAEASAETRDLLDILREIRAEARPASAPRRAEPGMLARAWRWLASTVLAPAPALAYLVVAALVLPLALVDRDGGAPSAVALPEVRTLESDVALRGAPVAPPVDVREGVPLLVEMRLDADAEMLEASEGAFEVRIVDEGGDGREVWRERVPVGAADERGVLRVMLGAEVSSPGAVRRVEVRFREVASALDGEVVFSKRIRFVADE